MSERPPAPPAGLSIVIPAYNEASRLTPTLERIEGFARSRGWDVELVLVDDGSHDSTARLMREFAARSRLPTRVLENPQNAGKGESVRRGVAEATRGLILFSDADLSTPIEEVDSLLAAIAAGADVAIGSRSTRGARVEVHQAWYRELMGKTFNRLVRLLAGMSFHDTQCGFKLFRGPVGKELFPRLRVRRFAFDVEVLFLALRRGYRVEEVPVVWRNSPNSRVNPLVDSTRMAWDLLRVRLRALLGGYDRP